MNTPVLIITFNRPDSTRRVLEAVLASGVQDLYLFQDAPRSNRPDDVEKCKSVREVVEYGIKKSSGDIRLHTKYADVNMGCGPGPVAAITWFFENVEQGIILEDDCLAHTDFFSYCEEMLEHYKDDERIFCIGGNNFLSNKIGNGSYFGTSGHHSTWGWASWRRVWQHFDYTLHDFSEQEFGDVIKCYYKDLRQREYWFDIFRRVKRDQMNNSCWDYQFYFSSWRRKCFAIAPNVNLVTNIGNDIDATHTANFTSMMYKESGSILPVIHSEVSMENFVDDYMMCTYIIPYEYGLSGFKRLPYRINKRIKRLFDHEGPWFRKDK